MASDSQPAQSVATVRSGNAAGFPRVQGRCPACGSASLFLAAEGYVTCSWLACPDPCSPSVALGIEFPAAPDQEAS